MKVIYFLFIVLTFLFTTSNGYKILALFHVPTGSHYNLGMGLVKGLAARGHEITFVSPYNSTKNIKNIKNIYLDGMIEVMTEFQEVFQSIHNVSTLTMFYRASGFTDRLAEATLKSNNLQALLKSNEKFDLVIFEAVFNDAHFGIAHHYKAPFVILTTTGSTTANHLTGNPAPYAFVPNMQAASSDKMTFAERLTNSALGIFFHLALQYKLMPAQENIYRKYFPNGPHLTELSRNVSIVLMNTYIGFETPRPYLPNMIPIAGYHVEEPKALPQDIQTVLDDAKDGAIYFSLGSNLKSASLPKESLEILLNSFKKFSQTILWKFEDEKLPGKPNNVFVKKWFPQTDVLAHPNVKLFISHGGLLSTTESVYRGVPILGIPFYGDQKTNILNVKRGGYGETIDFADLTEEGLTELIKEMLSNPKYSKNVKRLSAIIQDQPEKPLDRAVFWIEHVIRHNGGAHLRSAVVDMPLFQYLLLDVVIFVTVIIGTLFVGLFLCCKTICQCFSSKQTRDSEKYEQLKSKPKRE